MITGEVALYLCTDNNREYFLFLARVRRLADIIILLNGGMSRVAFRSLLEPNVGTIGTLMPGTVEHSKRVLYRCSATRSKMESNL